MNRSHLSGLRFGLRFFISLFLLCLCHTTQVSASPKAVKANPKGTAKSSEPKGGAAEKLDYERLSKSYNALLLSDPEVKDLAFWETTGGNIESYLKRYPDAANSRQAQLILAKLFEQAFSKRNFKPAQARSIYYYELFLQQAQCANPAECEAARLSLDKLKQVTPLELKPRESKAGDTAAASEKTSSPLIVIDPGHGGSELGAEGVDKVLEKDVVLNIAEELSSMLEQRLRARTLLTRKGDLTLSLAERTKIANDAGADLFISIHANASDYKTVYGLETYYLDNTNDKSSLKLAERENASLDKSLDELSLMFSDLIQGAKMQESISFAHYLQRHLVGNLSLYYEGVKDLGVKKAPFYVLVGAHMPCVLVEVSFIDHPVEGARLITKRYQRLVAQGLYQGIKSYFEEVRKL